jgi:hypothetical protein
VGEERKAGKKYRNPAVRKGIQGPTMLYMFLSFSVVSMFVNCTKKFFSPGPEPALGGPVDGLFCKELIRTHQKTELTGFHLSFVLQVMK